MSIFHKPTDTPAVVAADFIPFYNNGAWHLFYLKDWRDTANHGEGTPWWHLITRDFVCFDDLGEALARGPDGSQDKWVFTGCVIKHGGQFHIFYTGHNHHLAGQEPKKPMQAVMHATSPDLLTWTKDESFACFAPTEQGFEPHDWRDPFVFWNADAKEFWMLLAARRTAGPSRHRGLTVCCASRDLQSWEVRNDFYAPDAFYTHECPDLFRIGKWWYLVFSEFSDRSATRYRMSKKLEGPWIAPPDDAFDTRAFYAAKSAGDGASPASRKFGTPKGDGKRRYIFGWLPTRVDEKDDGGWQWGGHLVTHEIRQRKDGTLSVRVPKPVAAAFTSKADLSPTPALGDWKLTKKHARAQADAPGRFSALNLGPLPDEALIQTTIDFSAGTHGTGLLLRAGDTLDTYYQLRLEPIHHRVVFDRWPRPGDQPFMLERPIKLKPGHPVDLKVIVDGTCMVAYVNDDVALSCRMYQHRTGSLGLFVTDGEATFSGTVVRTRG